MVFQHHDYQQLRFWKTVTISSNGFEVLGLVPFTVSGNRDRGQSLCVCVGVGVGDGVGEFVEVGVGAGVCGCVCAGVGVGVGAGAGNLLCIPVCGIAGPNLIMYRMSHFHGPRTALDLAQQAACSTAQCYRRWC
jgi:hypothetical protein